LIARSSKLKGFKTWNLSFPGELGSYYVLYPDSWTVYSLPGQNVTLTCHQLSPILPHNYKDSSLPLCLFNWTVENNNDEEIEVSLMFTWQSGTSSNRFELKDVKSKKFEHLTTNLKTCGVLLKQNLKKMHLEYCVAAKKVDNRNIEINFK
jgi:non-lysosomal glucosylceramidase